MDSVVTPLTSALANLSIERTHITRETWLARLIRALTEEGGYDNFVWTTMSSLDMSIIEGAVNLVIQDNNCFNDCIPFNYHDQLELLRMCFDPAFESTAPWMRMFIIVVARTQATSHFPGQFIVELASLGDLYSKSSTRHKLALRSQEADLVCRYVG